MQSSWDVEVCIRFAQPADCLQLAKLREALWPESSASQHAQELLPILEGKAHLTMPLVNIVAEVNQEQVIGFLEASLRSHADGCDPTCPVGFIEGWYVAESHRRRGIAGRLLAAAEEWARSKGCIEMASDTWIENQLSQRVHEALGYTVVDRCVHYRKIL